MTLDLLTPQQAREGDHSHCAGTCACGRSGRLWVLGGQLVCAHCLRAAEERVAQAVEAGTLRGRRKGRR